MTFKYKQFQWVSSTGKVPYFDSTYELGYHRKLTEPLILDLGGRILSGDYNSGNLPGCRRNDLQYTISDGLGCSINTHVCASLAYSCDRGRNAQDGVANPQTREFNHHVLTLGALVKF